MHIKFLSQYISGVDAASVCAVIIILEDVRTVLRL